MVEQDALTTSLYSQLLEEAIANECITICPGIQGSFVKENRRDSLYWYWVGRNETGNVMRVYIGPDNSATQSLIVSLESRKVEAKQAIESMKRTVAAYRASGGVPNEPAHFKIIALLAQQNLFRKGIFVIGSHGFLSICNALGISSNNAFIRTTDIDFPRPQGVALAIPDERKSLLDVPSTIKSFDKNFFLVPQLDEKNPSTSLLNNHSKVKVDFLTVNRGSNKPVFFDDLGIAAEPLRFMDYLLGGEPLKGMIIGNYAIPVQLPNPVRFAIHKLIISQERQSYFKAKSQKDVAQAAILLDYLITNESEQVVDALLACLTIEGATKNIKKALLELSKHDERLSNFIADHLNAKPLKTEVNEDFSANLLDKGVRFN